MKVYECACVKGRVCWKDLISPQKEDTTNLYGD